MKRSNYEIKEKIMTILEMICLFPWGNENTQEDQYAAEALTDEIDEDDECGDFVGKAP